jgi:phospholipid/cholesterol/gamma-HCH transport system permease protein
LSSVAARHKFSAMLTGHTWIETIGHRALRSPAGVRARFSFGYAALSAALTVPRSLRREVRAHTREQLWRTGLRQLPMIALLGVALGLLIVGQAVALLRQVGAQQYMGTLMVTVVMRELGPLLTAFVLAARAGTASVVELGALRLAGQHPGHVGTRAMREWVVPRLRALSVATMCLTVYLIGVALACGYLMAFLQGVPLRVGAYCAELADAMHWMDFVLVVVKSALFGAAVAVICCFHGMTRLGRVEDFSQATTRAVVESFASCLALDALFLAGYLVR